MEGVRRSATKPRKIRQVGRLPEIEEKIKYLAALGQNVSNYNIPNKSRVDSCGLEDLLEDGGQELVRRQVLEGSSLCLSDGSSECTARRRR